MMQRQWLKWMGLSLLLGVCGCNYPVPTGNFGPECEGWAFVSTSDSVKCQAFNLKFNLDNKTCEGPKSVLEESFGVNAVKALDHCRANEYCKDGRCTDVGLSACEDLKPSAENSNGFGYCLPGYLCMDGKCRSASVNCTEENVSEVCGLGAECLNGDCKCGELSCGDRSNTCCKSEDGEGIGCFNLVTDPLNCGECGRECPEGFKCLFGECKESCMAGTIICGGKCVDPLSDLMYCGARGDCTGENAGQSCDSGMVCAGGECSKSCLAGQVLCGGKCIDPKSDLTYCGAALNGTCETEDPDDANYKGAMCPSGMACTDGSCLASCLDGQVYCGNKCIDPKTDTTYCGATEGGTCSSDSPDDSNYQGKTCVAGETCSEGRCVISCQDGLQICGGVCSNPKSDKENCGVCGMKCAENAQLCVDGKCACPTGYTVCPGEGCVDLAATHRATCESCIDDSWGNCDDNIKNGCETNLMTSNNNCATCGTKCESGTVCSNGNCDANCGGGLTKCEVEGVDACYNLTNDAGHCGECNKACPTIPHATAACSESACLYTCEVGYTNCGTPSEPNCLDLNAEDDNCGACGNRCGDLPNVSDGTCKGGVCQISCQEGFSDCNLSAADGCETKLSETNRAACETCLIGFANCDENWNNGCEVNAMADNANCGACNNTCESGKVCSNGVCSSSCLSGQTLCDSSCMTLGDMHLKDCATCADNYCDSDGKKLNGCEVLKGTSVEHCTACNSPCPSKDNATSLCNSGTCTYICATGYTNCGTNTEPNCIKLDSDDVNNCGYCGYKCEDGLSNVATAECKSGVCQVKTCKSGFANCDGNHANGCEIDGTSNLQYCGATDTSCSDKKCSAGYVCSDGSCGLSCQSGLTNCSGLCVKLSESVGNCGSCGNACGAKDQATAVCNNGACNYACNLGYTNCGTITEPNCKNTASDINNCGACGVTCGDGQACVQGVCTCKTSGKTNCNGTCKDLSKDIDNCGSCGNKCSAVAPINAEVAEMGCQSGECKFKCKKGYTNCGSGTTASTINCVDTQSDGQNCNSCNNKCPSGTACSAGACATSCPAGQQVCGSSCVTLGLVNLKDGCTTCADGYCDTDANKIGCETAIGSNVNHCSACNSACPAKDNATASCSNKKCVYACNAGYLNCGTAESPNCVATANSSAHCGSCNNNCDSSLANASAASCASGICGITCKAGYADCNGKASDGCETSIQGNADNCGGCGIKCSNFVPANAMFDKCSISGECTYQCVDGYTNCGGGTTASTIHCVDTKTDSTCCGANKKNCAMDGQVCDNGTCVSSTCLNTECLYEGQCLSNNAEKCGSSCTNCNTANNASSGSCSNGVCTIKSCKSGYCFDKNTKSCVNTATQCGSSCTNCNTAGNASAGTCSASGVCTITQCKAGYCLQNGQCVANSSDSACGASCNNCTALGKKCVNGTCAMTTCSSGYCLVNGQCTSNLADNVHCGSDCKDCTKAGAAGTGSASGYCSGGACKTTSCSSGYCLVNGQCVANSSNTSCGASCTNCSASNKVCSNGTCKCAANTCAVGSTCVANTSNSYCGASCTDCTASGKICSNGSCVYAACASGQCPVNNVCVSNTNNNQGCGANCTNCTTAYTSYHVTDAYCKSGVCKVAECSSGYADCNKAVADGCEANLNTSTSNCGACGHACGSGETCSSGTCKCGSGAACTLPSYATSVYCSSGRCDFTCRSGYHKDAAGTGCEADSDFACGANRTNCLASGMTCSGGNCVCNNTSCASGYFCCSGTCTNLNSTSTCGKGFVDGTCSTKQCLFINSDRCTNGECTCGQNAPCPSVSNGLATCTNGACSVICLRGYHSNQQGTACVADTDTACGSWNTNCTTSGKKCCNGMCKNLTSDVSNCGSCGNKCIDAPANATPACINSACSFQCNPNCFKKNNQCLCLIIDPIDPIPFEPIPFEP